MQKLQTTKHDYENGDSSNHLLCPNCGRCITCDDCECELKGEWIKRGLVEDE